MALSADAMLGLLPSLSEQGNPVIQPSDHTLRINNANKKTVGASQRFH
jgi:hypothetical protein